MLPINLRNRTICKYDLVSRSSTSFGSRSKFQLIDDLFVILTFPGMSKFI